MSTPEPRTLSRWERDEGTEEIVVEMKDIVPGRVYIAELIRLDTGKPVLGLRTTQHADREKKHICKH